MAAAELSFREGSPGDLPATFALSEHAIYDTAVRRGVLPPGRKPTGAEIEASWLRHRPLIECISAQAGGSYRLAEVDGELVGYSRVVGFGRMEELTELMVHPRHQRRGVGRALLERCWPGDPSPELGRVVVATGEPVDLGLYMSFGVMPIAGHWHLRQRTPDYLERRSLEIERVETAVHAITSDRAVREWQRLEPPVLGHERGFLHEFFARDRTCLASLEGSSGDARCLCWVSGEGEIGPAVGATPEDLLPVILAALDRVAATQEPENLSVFSTTISWWLLKRLRGLGFEIWWPSWVMCSVPLPGLDRYVPTRPPHVL